ncbi:hypothetical protein [Yinghuangia sp. YIM S09857]|uniref:hypothetical protein n=1 Tax=Yinghuangia sp. YIM S09857 TaxID=3436929 RepID=UPI003F530068
MERFLLDADGRPPGPPPQFTIAAKGYDRGEVDAFITSLRDSPHPGAAAPVAPSPDPHPKTAPGPARRWWRRRP